MNAIKEKCRPKHQVLVLKCYPRMTKGAVDVKPNSSELSYLLFYATSRRSKIQKIGAFLEKKTASDVWRLRIGNVQVTLGILAALVEKSPKDAALIAPYVLKILDQIIRSTDITMIESSLPTFEAFCENHDATSLFGDKEYLDEYESVVRSYAQFASTNQSGGKGPSSRPVQMRWKKAGLSAIKCVSAADALSSLPGRQVDVIVPIILENLWAENDNFLDVIFDRLQTEERMDTEKMMRRRNSVTTVRTTDGAEETNALALSGTAADVDNMAEEENGVLALQCLKSIFVVPNRSQIHVATGALLKFISERASRYGKLLVGEGATGYDGWAVTIFNIIARWAPVQDRYVILVAALDTLMRVALREDTMEYHLVLAAIISSLLQSDINLIGLSVMDVLLGLVRQIKKLFQLQTDYSHPANGDEEEQLEKKGLDSPPLRVKLHERLENCIADLATHVYYADQISDMIAAIVNRLKPGHNASVISLIQRDHAEGVEQGSPNEAGSAPDLADSQLSQLDAFFSHPAGRIAALRIIKAIIIVANKQTKNTGSLNLSRNKVPIQVWEGTQWLLRDTDGNVRKTYADVLITWLEKETSRLDSNAQDDSYDGQSSLRHNKDLAHARRAVSNATHREHHPKPHRRSPFLPLLHLAIFDNALQYIDYDNDMVLLHQLLTKLVFKLGVNSMRYGLPMIYRLQEEVQEVEQPIQKVRISALCHGYFWALTEKYDVESTVVGRAIHKEIARRRNKGFWVEGINVPPPSMSQTGIPGRLGKQPSWDLSALETEELLPFDDRSSLVQCLAVSYEEIVQSPPATPAASPTRGVSQPILSVGLSSAPNDEQSQLPESFKQDMLTDWSREALIEAVAAQGKSESLSGSKSGTTATRANRLTITTTNHNANGNRGTSPYGSLHNIQLQSAQSPLDRERFGSMSKARKSDAGARFSPSQSTSAKAGVASVDQLKMVLSGNVSPRTVGTAGLGEEDDDDSADSMVSYDYSLSETSFNPPAQSAETAKTTGEQLNRSLSASSRGLHPTTFSPPPDNDAVFHNDRTGAQEDVPPVPPLPNLSSFSGKNASLGYASGDRSRRNLNSRGSESWKERSIRGRESSGKGLDLQELLRGIDSTSGEGSLGNITKPPY